MIKDEDGVWNRNGFAEVASVLLGCFLQFKKPGENVPERKELIGKKYWYFRLE